MGSENERVQKARGAPYQNKEEESNIFKSSEKALEQDEFQDIMKEFEQEKQKIKRYLK